MEFTAIFPILVSVLFCCYYISSGQIYIEESPVVDTSSGSVKGITIKSRDGRDYYGYFGIPYAKPPVGPLRFESPQPPQKWDGIRDASEYGAMCMQADPMTNTVIGQEDCLFVNVFVPKVNNDKESLPVLVWIHGGMFAFDSSNKFGPEYFMDEDIVLVSLNYRLGILGFLSSGDGIVRGNMGLKDQALALKWVQTNIQNFSGDPNQVTIFGESAGGVSVHHHVLSPRSTGLFQKAISQSGNALPNWALRNNSAEQAKRFSKKLGCPTEHSKSMVECMRAFDGTKLLEVSLSDSSDDLRDPITSFIPSLEFIVDEHAFITELPLDILLNGNFNKVPWMSGSNSGEGLFVSAGFYIRSLIKQIIDNYQIFLPYTIWHHGLMDPLHTRKIMKFYLGDDEEEMSSIENFYNWTNLYTDSLFSSPKAIRLQAKYSPVFAYYYSFKGEYGMVDELLKILGIDPLKSGACHFDEVAMLFPFPGENYIGPTDKDYGMSKAMVKAWVSFASDAEPNLEFNGVAWPSVEVKDDKVKNYMSIDSQPSLIDEPNSERNQFWNTLNK